MSGIISGLAAQYGRHLVCYDENGRVTGEGEAFFQPLTERQWQRIRRGAGGLQHRPVPVPGPGRTAPGRARRRRLGGV